MDMHENVAFDPSVRSIEVQAVVFRSTKHIVDEMNDRTRSIPAGEIDDVIVANRAAEKISCKNPVAPALDSSRAMDRFERKCLGWKKTIGHDERRIIQRNILVSRRSKCEMIKVHCAALGMNRGRT